MQNMMVVIVNSSNKKMSGIKTKTPKTVTAMKELCTKYTKMFGEEYKVKHCIKTSKGVKIV